MKIRLASVLVVALVFAGPRPAYSQTEVTFELGASQVGPPSGVDGATARFAVSGLRASRYAVGGSGAFASVLAGRAFSTTTGGDFFSGTLGGVLRRDWGRGWNGGLDVRALAFEVRAPFPYRAFATEGGPTLRYRSGWVSVRVNGVAGVGRSRVELRRTSDGPSRLVDDDLWRLGGTTELLVGSGGTWLGLGSGAHHTSGGTYSAGGLRLVFGGTRAAAELRVDVWDTPLGTETTGGLAIVVPVSGGWSLRGFLGKSEPDPLTLAEPGSGSGGLLLGRTLYRAGTAPSRVSLYEVVAGTDSGARVKISVTAPASAARVSVLGDFSLWDPVPMRREGPRWTAELEIDYGTHHFGFLVDDEWYVPEDAPDVVPDEWGRRSATLVIEGVGS